MSMYCNMYKQAHLSVPQALRFTAFFLNETEIWSRRVFIPASIASCWVMSPLSSFESDLFLHNMFEFLVAHPTLDALVYSILPQRINPRFNLSALQILRRRFDLLGSDWRRPVRMPGCRVSRHLLFIAATTPYATAIRQISWTGDLLSVGNDSGFHKYPLDCFRLPYLRYLDVLTV